MFVWLKKVNETSLGHRYSELTKHLYSCPLASPLNIAAVMSPHAMDSCSASSEMKEPQLMNEQLAKGLNLGFPEM